MSQIQERPIDTDSGNAYGAWVVKVFNNDVTPYDAVISILMKATECSKREAETETWEIHHMGSSVVHHGAEEECEKVAKVISSIGIDTEVYQE